MSHWSATTRLCLLQWVFGASSICWTSGSTTQQIEENKEDASSSTSKLQYRTLRSGLSNDLQQIDDSRKTVIIKLKRLNINIATLHEIKTPSSRSLQELEYTFLWQGKDSEEPCQHIVGFVMRNSLHESIKQPTVDSECILAMHHSTASGPVNILSIYARTLCSTAQLKDQLYEEIDNAIRSIPTSEHLFMLGDFNTRVGSDHGAWRQSTW